MRRIHWTFPTAALCLVGAIVSGCVLLQPASPTTTVTDASGQQVTLNWADYPADPQTEPADVLAAPRAEQVEQVEQVGAALRADLQRPIDGVAPGLRWSGGSAGVFPVGGNGYGGQSLHRVFNGADLSATEAPDDWPALAAALDAALAAHGFDPIAWEFEREPHEHETAAERDADVIATLGSLDPDEMWQWSGMATDGASWVSVMLMDADRGVGAPADAGLASPQLLSLLVGASVIAAADEQSYRDGIAPFEGLERPESTHSD